MKKSRFINLSAAAIILGIFLILLSSVSVKAADVTDTANQIQSGIGQIEQAKNIVTQPETQAEIVKQQWARFLAGTAVGKFFVAATPYIKKFDPLFKLVLGTGFEWTWVFILCFVLASSLIMFFKRIVSVFTVYFEVKTKILDYGIPLAITILLSLSNITITITKLIVRLINAWFTSVLMQIVAGIGVAILIFWFFSLSNVVKQLEISIRNYLEKKKLKKDVEELKKEVRKEKERGERREKGEKTPTEKEVEEELEEEEPTAEEKETEEEKKRKEELKKKGQRFIENIGRGIEESEQETGE